MIYHQLFRITGVANAITYDGGLKSTVAEPKRLRAIHMQMDANSTLDDNEFQGYHERAKVFDVPDKLINTVGKAEFPVLQRCELMSKIPVDIDIPAGETFKAAVKCSATAVNARGIYEYEIIS